MAGDWIKMRCELQSHPKVVRILSATQADKFRVIGGLHAVWSVFDAHSKDGSLHGYTPQLLDHIIGWEGFSQAMIYAEWLIYDGDETLVLPEFDEHNSQSAKRRAEDQKRKRNARNSPKNVTQECGQNADKMRTREEKRRDINTTTSVVVASKARRHRLPADFYPNEVGIDKADKAGISLAVELGRFRDYHDGKGTLMLDWQAAWRTWVSNAVKFSQKGTNNAERRDATIAAFTGEGRPREPALQGFCERVDGSG